MVAQTRKRSNARIIRPFHFVFSNCDRLMCANVRLARLLVFSFGYYYCRYHAHTLICGCVCAFFIQFTLLQLHSV